MFSWTFIFCLSFEFMSPACRGFLKRFWICSTSVFLIIRDVKASVYSLYCIHSFGII